MSTQVIDPYRMRRTTDILRAEIENLKLRLRSVERAPYTAVGVAGVGATIIPNLYITTEMIENLAVTAAKIDNATITATQIAAATILGSNIAAATIEAGNIANATITATQIEDATITGSKIANATITSTQIHDATITGAKIANATIEAGNIAASTITGGLIAANTITGGNIASETIQAGNIENLTITAAKIANLTITGGPSGKIAAATITEDNIVAATITATSIAGLTITGAKIAAATITADKLVANTITASQITTDWLTGLKFDFGSGLITLDDTYLTLNSDASNINLLRFQYSDATKGYLRGTSTALALQTVNAADIVIDSDDELSLTSDGDMDFAVGTGASFNLYYGASNIVYTSGDRLIVGHGWDWISDADDGGTIGYTNAPHEVRAYVLTDLASRFREKNITPITRDYLATIKTIPIVQYQSPRTPDDAPKTLGTLGEDLPEDVRGPGGDGVNLMAYCTLLLRCNQQLLSRVEAVEARLDAMA